VLKRLVTVTEQITTPPPPLPEPLHCWTSVTGSADVVVVVAHVPPPAPIGPAAPVHLVTVTVEGDVTAIVPVPVT
jgi:hypothetical protein